MEHLRRQRNAGESVPRLLVLSLLIAASLTTSGLVLAVEPAQPSRPQARGASAQPGQTTGLPEREKPARPSEDTRREESTSQQPAGVPGWATLTRDVLALLLSWPVVVLLLFIYLFQSRSAARKLAGLFKPFRSLKLFGTEFKLDDQAGRELGEDAERAFAEYRTHVKRVCDRWVEVNAIREKFEGVVEAAGKGCLSGAFETDFRATLHVPDILFADTLYQLVDYYPGGGGRGRSWSIRFGIIGKAWRLGESQLEADVPTEPRRLVVDWGMTREEAVAAGQGRKSFACICLRDKEGSKIAIFYIDATKRGAFSADSQRVEQEILDQCEKRGLTSSLARFGLELRTHGPVIHVHD